MSDYLLIFAANRLLNVTWCALQKIAIHLLKDTKLRLRR